MDSYTRASLPVGIGAQSRAGYPTPLKCVEAELLVHDAAAGAEHGLTVASDIPGQAKARGDIIVVAVVGRLSADLNQAEYSDRNFP